MFELGGIIDHENKEMVGKLPTPIFKGLAKLIYYRTSVFLSYFLLIF